MGHKKSLMVELYNKYPQHRVEASGESISVRDGKSGKLILHLQKTCHGAYECDQKHSGAKECHDRSPIAESARVFELRADGSVGKVEGWEDRRMLSQDYLDRFGKIPSVMEEKELAAKEAAAKSKEEAAKRIADLKKQKEEYAAS